MEHEIKLRLKWQHAWPDRPGNHFSALSPDYEWCHNVVGSILRRTHGPTEGLWDWSLTAIVREIPAVTRGVKSTPRAAAAELERCWFEVLANPANADSLKRPK